MNGKNLHGMFPDFIQGRRQKCPLALIILIQAQLQASNPGAFDFFQLPQPAVRAAQGSGEPIGQFHNS
ncbi:MAG: hypothetical protein ACLRVT_05740, partial [Oscillospiraceae bacterium]